jgi:hypothetical protein
VFLSWMSCHVWILAHGDATKSTDAIFEAQQPAGVHSRVRGAGTQSGGFPHQVASTASVI